MNNVFLSLVNRFAISDWSLFFFLPRKSYLRWVVWIYCTRNGDHLCSQVEKSEYFSWQVCKFNVCMLKEYDWDTCVHKEYVSLRKNGQNRKFIIRIQADSMNVKITTVFENYVCLGSVILTPGGAGFRYMDFESHGPLSGGFIVGGHISRLICCWPGSSLCCTRPQNVFRFASH